MQGQGLRKALLLALLLVLPALAQAQLAYTARTAHLRAGPARDYPVVAILPAGLAIDVQGCLDDYSWCDVIAGPSRGWMYAGNIDYAYQGSYVPLISYGPQLGVVIVGFLLLDYWTLHYHDRPWYPERDAWVHRHGPGWPVRPGPHREPPRQALPEAPPPQPRLQPPLPRQQPPQHNRPGAVRPPPPEPPRAVRPPRPGDDAPRDPRPPSPPRPSPAPSGRGMG